LGYPIEGAFESMRRTVDAIQLGSCLRSAV
jgi:hypothetical protein